MAKERLLSAANIQSRGVATGDLKLGRYASLRNEDARSVPERDAVLLGKLHPRRPQTSFYKFSISIAASARMFVVILAPDVGNCLVHLN